MNSKYCVPGPADLETIDRVARAAHLWIRHGQAGRYLTPIPGVSQTQHNLAAGLITGLCDALELDDQCALMSAYAYALLDGETEHALAIAYALSDRQIESKYQRFFLAGRAAADKLIAVVQHTGLDGITPVEYPASTDH